MDSNKKLKFKVPFLICTTYLIVDHPHVAVRITERDGSIVVLIEIPGDLRQSTHLFLSVIFTAT